MDTAKAQNLVDHLGDNIDDLEEQLQPVLSQALNESTKKLPLLDKAKLHVLIVYAVESLLFSYLKLQNVDAKEHHVFRELTRVKQYFEKLKNAEEGPVKSVANLSLNKEAAARIIKHSLAGNDKLDLARLEKEAREKLLAKRKLKELEASMKEKAQANEQAPQSVEEEIVNQIAAEIEQADGISTLAVPETEARVQQPSKKEKKRKRKEEQTAINGQRPENSKAAKKARKKSKKEAKATREAPD